MAVLAFGCGHLAYRTSGRSGERLVHRVLDQTWLVTIQETPLYPDAALAAIESVGLLANPDAPPQPDIHNLGATPQADGFFGPTCHWCSRESQ